jgi:hypothetical protein
MLHSVVSKILVGCAAIGCLAGSSGCYRHRRDPVYVERVHVHVDEHRREEHRDERR